MFEKLKRKIYLNLFIIPAVLTISISGVSSAILSNYLSEDHQNAITNSVELTRANLDFYLSVLESDLTLLSNDTAVNHYALTGEDAIAALQRMNATVSADSLLLGITVYRSQHIDMLASNGLSGLPNYAQIRSLNEVDTFLSSEHTSSLLLRHQYIADNYDFMAYDESHGMLAYFVKVFASDTLVGLLVADFDSQYLYDTFFNYEPYRNFTVQASLIAQGNALLKRGDNDRFVWTLSDSLEGYVKHSLALSYYEVTIFDRYTLVTVIDNRLINTHIIWLNVAFFSIDILLILFALWATRRMAETILHPLNDIAKKMDEANIH